MAIIDSNPDFIPLWTSIIQQCFKSKQFDYDLKEKLTKQNELNMGEFGSCMVGEAHNYDTKYYKGNKEERCERCVSLSLKACFLKYNNIEPFYNFKKELHDHMVNRH